MTLEARIAARIRREGPIAFADFQAMALYDEPDGFFTGGGGAGRGGRDFMTSPEVGSLFGALVARHLDAVWHRLDAPDPFVVVEVGAGRGRLAADVLRAGPGCAPALRYVLIERSARLRAEQRELLTLEPADEALGPFARRADLDEPLEAVPGSGPIVSSLDDLPAMSLDGVVIANELLDNLPVHLVERVEGEWSEVRVRLDDEERLVEALVPAPPELAIEADRVGSADVPGGSRLPIPVATKDWLERIAMLLDHGEVLLIDYMDDVRGLLQRGQASWLRTYAGHGRGSAPLDAPGHQDITCDVPIEYLGLAAARAGFTIAGETSQAEWLAGLGVDELVAAGDATWRDRAHIGDLEAIAGRSRGVEAAALTDPDGLGAHRVVTLTVGAASVPKDGGR
ncbi:MAG: SAM-dependent methyltransferase [Acidimicrobiia bacterium]